MLQWPRHRLVTCWSGRLALGLKGDPGSSLLLAPGKSCKLSRQSWNSSLLHAALLHLIETLGGDLTPGETGPRPLYNRDFPVNN
ncbi:hypothetical protein RRG08_003115 [Elysia crispata]|uniref:Uncharacterized protein n=1 Tax=Elysia crispata TaxID=231223 RepID=A0AAE1B6E4_9GAST|nr:hypothetical protein RRG08_003115 [Elysia crispata]